MLRFLFFIGSESSVGVLNRWGKFKVCGNTKEVEVGQSCREMPLAKRWALEDESMGSMKRETQELTVYRYKQAHLFDEEVETIADLCVQS